MKLPKANAEPLPMPSAEQVRELMAVSARLSGVVEDLASTLAGVARTLAERLPDGAKVAKPGPKPRLAERIVAALGEAGKPLKGALLAKRVGVNNESHFRETASALVRAGKIRYVEKMGYAAALEAGD